MLGLTVSDYDTYQFMGDGGNYEAPRKSTTLILRRLVAGQEIRNRTNVRSSIKRIRRKFCEG